MKIDEKYSIDKNGTLTFSETRIRKDGKSKGEEFLFTESYYYPTIQTALKKYLDLVLLEEAEDIKHCISLIESTYNKITKLNTQTA